MTEHKNGKAAVPPVAVGTPRGSVETLFPQLHDELCEVEARLRAAIHSHQPVVPEVYLHTVHAGGKRVRPALALLAGRLAGVVGEPTFDVAVAVEMIHLASLIHDDVVDEGERRRARLTANRIWGNKSAVLVADFIHAVAYRLLARRCSAEVVARLSATVLRMVEGELAQMFNEGSLELDESVYFQMIGDKTACLMALSCELGAEVSGASPENIARLSAYGMKIGLAFQIVDDLLDLTGDEARLGKPVGNDIRCGRMTLPLIWAVRQGAAVREALVPRICRDHIGLDELHAIRDVLDDCGALEYAAERARSLSDEAIALLEGLPLGEAREALETLALYIVARTR